MCCIGGRLVLAAGALMLLVVGVHLLMVAVVVVAAVYVVGIAKVYRRNNRAQAEAVQEARNRTQQWRA